MALESITSCPICSGANFQLYNQCTDFTTTHELFNLQICNNCEFVFTSPRPDAGSLGKYYESNNYISHSNDSKSLFEKMYTVIRSYALRWKLELIQQRKATGKILDYGCGTGEFINVCKKAGWQCFGVEPANKARTKALNLSNAKIVDSLSQLANEKFDVITLWHVLEHIENLNEKLFELKQHLTENGIIFIAVPNRESLDARHYKSFWAGFDVPRHLWHFSQSNMKSLLSSHGLKHIQTIPMKQDSYYVSLLSEGYQHPRTTFFKNLIKAFIIGTKSNMAARKDLNYSSLVYIAHS